MEQSPVVKMTAKSRFIILDNVGFAAKVEIKDRNYKSIGTFSIC